MASALLAEVETMRGCRDALRAFFAGLKADLLEKRLNGLSNELARLASRIGSLQSKESEQRSQRDDIKRAIAENGGDRIERLRREIAGKQITKDERMARAEQYGQFARAAELPEASDADTF